MPASRAKDTFSTSCKALLSGGLFSFCFLAHFSAGQFRVFSACSLTSPKVPLLFVLLKHRLHLVVQASVDLRKLRGDILMHSAFAHAKFLCSRAYCRLIFNYVMSEYDTSFLISFPCRSFLQCISHPHCITFSFHSPLPAGSPRAFPFSQFMRKSQVLCMLCRECAHSFRAQRPPLPSEVSYHTANRCPHRVHLTSWR